MNLRQDITNWGLLMASLGAMIGSGWLFGALYAAQIAGPASIFSWIIGGILLIIIGLNYAELTTALPLTGGIARYTHITHGSLVSFSTTWLAWLSCVATAPTEAQAVLEYAVHYIPWDIYVSRSDHTMALSGWASSIVLLFLFTVVNMYTIKAVLKFNTLITCWKILIPVLVCISIACSSFSLDNFQAYNGFNPCGIKHVLWAIPAAGVIFSFLGFRECISLAGETKNPQRALPFALIGSVVICTILYVALQIVLIGALTPDMLNQGWNNLSVTVQAGPLAAIALTLGMTWLVKLIYIDAFISPVGTGIVYTATTARLNYGISANKYLPAFMMKTNKYGVPVYAIGINFMVGVFLLAPLPTWQALVAFQSSAIVLSYGLGPICLIILRKKVPQLKRPFVLSKSSIISAVTFYVCTLIAYWTGWNTIRQTGFAIISGLILMVLYRLFSSRGKSYDLAVTSCLWFVLYILGITIISFLGSFGGGKNFIPFGWDFLIIAVFSGIIFILAISNSYSKEIIEQKIYGDPEYVKYLETEKAS